MKAREPERVSIIRSAIGAIGNAEAVRPEPVSLASGVVQVEVSRRELSDDDVQEVLRLLRRECQDGAEELDRVGEPERAAVLRRQAEILLAYIS
jgi:uncharacterized protein YqeY